MLVAYGPKVPSGAFFDGLMCAWVSMLSVLTSTTSLRKYWWHHFAVEMLEEGMREFSGVKPMVKAGLQKPHTLC